jgi:hypothetical protein
MANIYLFGFPPRVAVSIALSSRTTYSLYICIISRFQLGQPPYPNPNELKLIEHVMTVEVYEYHVVGCMTYEPIR